MIDYKNIADSINYYESLGYVRIEAPWTVSEYTTNITKPPGAINYQLKYNDKCLVASGEQSFLYLYLKGSLPSGKFQTVTPCFRYESFDDMHSKYFIKNELIITGKEVDNTNTLPDIIYEAFGFFSNYIPKERLSIIENSTQGRDIVVDGKYELGSYGKRTCPFLKWIYGTGCAEPRLSTICKLL